MWFLTLVIAVIIMAIAQAMDKKEEFAGLCVLIMTAIFGIACLIDKEKNIGVGLVIAAVIQGFMMKGRMEEIERKDRWEADRPNREERQRELNEKYERVSREQERQMREKQVIEQAKKKVETIAMNKAINYENSYNRTPSDVASQNLGYDIKSSNSNETRYIEVKGKSDTGDIEITENEWAKAKELENNYYLYVVYNCLDYPNLAIVRNPANKLSVNDNSNSRKYLISRYEINRCSS